MVTLEEKVKELYNSLKAPCKEKGLCLAWEVHKALNKFRKEHPDLDEKWSREAYGL